MPFNPKFESDYIRQFAEIVRRGASPAVCSEWLGRIRAALLKIDDLTIRNEAEERVARISTYGFIHIEDPQGSRAGIADEIEELASFVNTI